MSEPDYAIHLIRAEQALAKVYPCMTERKVSRAVLYALEATEELARFIGWVVANRGKP